jgi:glycosyltransferase involved in cell wall biosynthesis
MHIAFFSYEFPDETGGGGIGTYLQLVTRLLSEKGHRVIVFAATRKDKSFWESSLVFRIPANTWKQFNLRLPDYFPAIHKKISFDIAECTDFNGCGLYLKKELAQLPVVVRLHTPLYMVDRLLFQPMSFFQKLRFALGSFKRGKWPNLPQYPSADDYAEEFELVKLAERISSPGISIYQEMKRLGFELEGKTEFIPLPFEIPAVTIEARESIKQDPHILYVGRLELRKGVIDLAKSVSKVLQVYPGARFTFIGENSSSPKGNKGMMDYLQTILKDNLASVNFTGKLSHESALSYFATGDIFVFPSYYESFGLACCEAMAAGRAVIGGKQGGMAEIIEDEQSGLLIDPGDPVNIANKIIRLINDDKLRSDLGHGARKRIREYLDPEKIIKSQLSCYQHAIERCKINSRSVINLTEAARNVH